MYQSSIYEYSGPARSKQGESRIIRSVRVVRLLALVEMPSNPLFQGF